MIITNKLIESYDPCTDGINEFNEKYPKYRSKLTSLLSLDNIPYENKVWLATKVVDLKTLQQWAIECAEMMVNNYNDVYPDDNRLDNCIEMTKRYLEGKCSLDELEAARSAAESAASSPSIAQPAYPAAYSVYSAARSAAKSAARSIAQPVYPAAYSVYSAARSAAESAAPSIAQPAVYSADQDAINLSILIALLENQ